MAMTILDVALAKGAQPEPDGSINGAELARVGFAIVGGCACCHATCSAGNGYPSRTGYWLCADCLGDQGFDTVKQYDAWSEEWDREDEEEND